MNFVISQLTDPKDDIDNRIQNEFMGLYMANDLSRKQVEFKRDSEIAGRVYQLWLNTGICLIKANAHQRNFMNLLQEKRAEFELEISSDGNSSKQHYYWDLSVEVEGALTQLKAALDTFALIIGTVTAQSGIRGWSKKTPVGGSETFSGQNIINALNRNIPAAELKHLRPLVDLLEADKDHVSAIVNVRDGFTHPQRIFTELTTGFYYDSKKNGIVEPTIKFRNVAMAQPAFVDMAFNFILETLIYSGIGLLNGIAGGMTIQYDESNKKYSWHILQSTLTKPAGKPSN